MKCIVVSDQGRPNLGLGDQGAGGMGIPDRKDGVILRLAEFIRELPSDFAGRGNEQRGKVEESDLRRMGASRVCGAEYDEFVDIFVQHVKRRWPHVLLQWEDFAGSNAARLLARYRNELCTFNDDIQGHRGGGNSIVISAINVTGVPFERQKLVVLGFGSAGLGITRIYWRGFIQDKGVPPDDARKRFYAIDRDGLITDKTQGDAAGADALCA